MNVAAPAARFPSVRTAFRSHDHISSRLQACRSSRNIGHAKRMSAIDIRDSPAVEEMSQSDMSGSHLGDYC
ncbi:uncharacterized protein LDX57_003283 [Aspergillus melleus]|uniref:uncharacterized protein n=1 Tax=Aspergillus melleus TaxID=138277 RepID=UPI001E8EF0B4|nr:uncharacterized protein LDX57_003283 [Aspergillus melleus]KAH8425532.1 hypothetical protein LDX57_003283 [Aspergillus melleus]